MKKIISVTVQTSGAERAHSSSAEAPYRQPRGLKRRKSEGRDGQLFIKTKQSERASPSLKFTEEPHTWNTVSVMLRRKSRGWKERSAPEERVIDEGRQRDSQSQSISHGFGSLIERKASILIDDELVVFSSVEREVLSEKASGG